MDHTRLEEESSWGRVAADQAGEDEVLDQGSGSGDGEKWMNWRDI